MYEREKIILHYIIKNEKKNCYLKVLCQLDTDSSSFIRVERTSFGCSDRWFGHDSSKFKS